jgi:recombination protein RecA
MIMAHSSAQDLQFLSRSNSPWRLDQVAGRFIEISSTAASAALTLTFSLIGEAQERGELVGWVTSTKDFFYPPDAVRNGIDLAALVVIRLTDRHSIARAGEKLLRSGGFGLIVLDLGAADIAMPLQTRLTGLAHRHRAALVCLTKKNRAAFSLGSLVSLRVHAQKKRVAQNRFACALRVLKDKQHGPTWNHEVLYNGPAGLC